MKITVWQQFSSNHSASFTVAGKFASPEKAEKAAQVVAGMIQRIRDYYHAEYSTGEDFWNFANRKELSSVEKTIKQELSLHEWMMPLDWTYFEKVEDMVILFHDILFVSIDWDTWTGQSPIDQLIEHLGGDVVVSVDGGHRESYLLIRCQAPDERSAIELEKNLIKKQIYPAGILRTYLSIPNTSLGDWSLLERHDNTLTLEIYAYSMKRKITFLQAYVSYLEGNGCINFSYSLKEVSNFNDSNP